MESREGANRLGTPVKPVRLPDGVIGTHAERHRCADHSSFCYVGGNVVIQICGTSLDFASREEHFVDCHVCARLGSAPILSQCLGRRGTLLRFKIRTPGRSTLFVFTLLISYPVLSRGYSPAPVRHRARFDCELLQSAPPGGSDGPLRSQHAPPSN